MNAALLGGAFGILLPVAGVHLDSPYYWLLLILFCLNRVVR